MKEQEEGRGRVWEKEDITVLVSPVGSKKGEREEGRYKMFM